MATNTPNLNLLKKDPINDQNDTFNIKTMLNENWDKIDQTVANKVDKVNGKTLSSNDFSNTEKTKLAGIETGAKVNNISDTNATDLTDGGNSTLHYHSSDRDRANHTGTQLSSTISNFAATVRATVLTGLSTATNAVVTATDTVLSALGKLQAQITSLNSTKLNSSSYTASDVLNKIKTVDGSGSGLDADTVDGLHLSNIAQFGNYYGSSDLNNLITPGIWNCQNTCSNKPEASWGTVIVGYISNHLWIQQLWLGQNGTMFFRRSYDSSGTRVWGSWNKVYNTGNIIRSTSNPSGGSDGDIWIKYNA